MLCELHAPYQWSEPFTGSHARIQDAVSSWYPCIVVWARLSSVPLTYKVAPRQFSYCPGMYVLTTTLETAKKLIFGFPTP